MSGDENTAESSSKGAQKVLEAEFDANLFALPLADAQRFLSAFYLVLYTISRICIILFCISLIFGLLNAHVFLLIASVISFLSIFCSSLSSFPSFPV